MSKKYDVSLKVLVETHLPDWLALVPRKPIGRVRVIDSDLATVTADADKVLRIEDPVPWILHLELQARRDPTLEWRVPWYNALLEYKHQCLVHSLVVLLTKSAETPGLTGEWTRGFAGETPYRYLRYQVIRAWEMRSAELAYGPWGMFPLAPLCDDAPPTMPGLIQRMGQRVLHEHADAVRAKELWFFTEVLMGLRYEDPVLELLMQEMKNMIDLRDSLSYQKMLAAGIAEGKAKGIAEGKAEGIRETILRLGKIKLGKPSAKVLRELNSISEVLRLSQLSERILDVDSWNELLSSK